MAQRQSRQQVHCHTNVHKKLSSICASLCKTLPRYTLPWDVNVLLAVQLCSRYNVRLAVEARYLRQLTIGDTLLTLLLSMVLWLRQYQQCTATSTYTTRQRKHEAGAIATAVTPFLQQHREVLHCTAADIPRTAVHAGAFPRGRAPDSPPLTPPVALLCVNGCTNDCVNDQCNAAMSSMLCITGTTLKVAIATSATRTAAAT
eukprot:19686-Heterococcus_DN1.PRE.2